MATASSPVSILDSSSPAGGTRSARRKPEGSAGGPLVIPIGRAAAQQPTENMPAQPPAGLATEAAGPSNQQQQQQQAPAGGDTAAHGGAGPGPSSQQQRQQQQQQQRMGGGPSAAAAVTDSDVIVIDSDDDDDDVVITAVKAGIKRPRVSPLQQHPQQQQRQQQQQQQQPPRRLIPGQPPMPTWEQPAVPPRPPSPEPTFKCLICLDGIKPDSMATTPCGHMFCYECIMDAVRVSKKCPKCRKTMQVKSIKRLYPN